MVQNWATFIFFIPFWSPRRRLWRTWPKWWQWWRQISSTFVRTRESPCKLGTDKMGSRPVKKKLIVKEFHRLAVCWHDPYARSSNSTYLVKNQVKNGRHADFDKVGPIFLETVPHRIIVEAFRAPVELTLHHVFVDVRQLAVRLQKYTCVWEWTTKA